MLSAIILTASLSCRDEILPPTMGTLEVELASGTAGGFEGARISIDDQVVVESAASARYSFTLGAGTHRVVVEKPCMAVLPADEQVVTVEAARTRKVSFSLQPSAGAIEVTSTMAGAEIFVNGEPTGQRTPATVGCVEPGQHTVAVQLLGAIVPSDSVQTVTVEDGPVAVEFALHPVSQTRGVFLELITATYCPNCDLADEVVENFWSDASLTDRGYIGVQVHLPWQGRDSLRTAFTESRATLYGSLGSAPAAMFNGLHRADGTSDVHNRYRDRCERFWDGREPGGSPVAFHWLGAEHTRGSELRATLRVVVVDDIAEADTVKVLTAYYKDGLVTAGIRGGRIEQVTYHRVMREYRDLGTMERLGLTRRGDWADFEVVFPLDWDTRPSGAHWSEDRMGLIVFTQHMPSRMIHHVSHMMVP